MGTQLRIFGVDCTWKENAPGKRGDTPNLFTCLDSSRPQICQGLIFFFNQGSKLAQYYMLRLRHLIVFCEETPHFIGERNTAQRG